MGPDAGHDQTSAGGEFQVDYIADEGYAYTYSRCLNFRDQRLLKGFTCSILRT